MKHYSGFEVERQKALSPRGSRTHVIYTSAVKL